MILKKQKSTIALLCWSTGGHQYQQKVGQIAIRSRKAYFFSDFTVKIGQNSRIEVGRLFFHLTWW
jgi:hypothetical protein